MLKDFYSSKIRLNFIFLKLVYVCLFRKSKCRKNRDHQSHEAATAIYVKLV